MKQDKYMGMLCEAPNYVELTSSIGGLFQYLRILPPATCFDYST